jgi:hypothetical protein
VAVQVVEPRAVGEVDGVAFREVEDQEGEEDSHREEEAEIGEEEVDFQEVARVGADGEASEGIVSVSCFLWFLGLLGEWSYEELVAEDVVLSLLILGC